MHPLNTTTTPPPYSPTPHHGRTGPLAGHVVSRSVAVTTRMSDTRHLAPLSSPRVSTRNLFARRSPGARPLAWPAGDDRRRYRRYERNGPPQWNPQMTKLRTSYTARGVCIGTCKSTWSPHPPTPALLYPVSWCRPGVQWTSLVAMAGAGIKQLLPHQLGELEIAGGVGGCLWSVGGGQWWTGVAHGTRRHRVTNTGVHARMSTG